jgi:hypothetical protein
VLFRGSEPPRQPLPLAGRKLQVHTDWAREG